MSSDERETGSQLAGDPELVRALHRLNSEQLSQVSTKFTRHTFAPGEVIMRQGDAPDRFYIVLRGQADISHESLSGQSKVIDRRLPGEFFGEIGLLHNQPRSATVYASAAGEVELLALDRQDFLDLIDESKATEAHVAQEMIKRLIHLAKFQ